VTTGVSGVDGLPVWPGALRVTTGVSGVDGLPVWPGALRVTTGVSGVDGLPVLPCFAVTTFRRILEGVEDVLSWIDGEAAVVGEFRGGVGCLLLSGVA